MKKRFDILRSFWFRALGRIGYRRLYVFEQLLTEAMLRFQPQVKADIRLLQATDENDFLVLCPGKSVYFRQSLAQGRQCWGAWCDGALRQIFWAATGKVRIDYVDCLLALEDGEVYLYEALTEPAWRGRGLTPATLSACYRAFFHQGCLRALIAVLPENQASLATIKKLGPSHIGRLASIGWGRWRRCFYRPASGSHRPVTVTR